MTARPEPAEPPRDPLAWCWALTAAFALLVFHRLAIPSKEYFDEIHYLPAARNLLALSEARNLEHPWLGKELIAASMWVFGDNAFGWRCFAAVAGVVALFAAMRGVWWASLSRPATVLAGVLIASDFLFFMIARIAMLDPFMLAFAMLMLWFFARALRRPEHGRRDLALTGLAMGCALASKWGVGPLLVFPGLVLAGARWAALKGRRSQFLSATDAGPVPGVTLLEAAIWLAAVPIAVYLLTFIPLGWFTEKAVPFSHVLAFQQQMVDLQESVVRPHPYQSVWWQWVLNLRPIWFLYEFVDGAQRGVLVVGNPLTMLLGLAALPLCLWWGWRAKDRAMLAVAVLYGLGLGGWIVAVKPVQFYYHYLLPSTFLQAALALVLARLYVRGGRWRWPAWATCAASLGLFAWFYPILSSGVVHGKQAFETYTWLNSWR